MAKRAPVGQKPFNALDKGLAAMVMNPPPPLAESDDQVRVEPVNRVVEPPEPGIGRAAVGETYKSPPKANGRALDAPGSIPGPSVMARRPVVTPKLAADAAPEKLSREKRFLLSPAEEREIERCVDRIAEGFGGTPVKLSHIIRACLTVVRHAESEVIRHAQEVGQLTRPPNGDAMALAEFEHELAKVLAQAFHAAPALR